MQNKIVLDTIGSLLEQTHEDAYFPTDPILKDALISAFKDLACYQRSNRPDVNTTNHEISEGISEGNLLRQIRKEYKQKIHAHSQGECNDQPFIAECVASTYEKFQNTYPNIALPAYCAEMTYLLYDNLGKRGVKPENLLVVGFISNDEDHVALLYSSNTKIIEEIRDDYFEQKENNEASEAYNNFLGICSERGEEEILFLDPWSKNNKILSLNKMDQDGAFEKVIDDYLGVNASLLEKKEFRLHAFFDGVLQEAQLSNSNELMDRERVAFLTDSFDPDEEMESSDSESQANATKSLSDQSTPVEEDQPSSSGRKRKPYNRFTGSIFSQNIEQSSSDSESELEKAKKEKINKIADSSPFSP